MPFLYPNSLVNLDYFTDNNASGGPWGEEFAFIKLDKGAVLKRIKAWRSDWRLRGVEVWMSDGSRYLAGTRVGNSSEYRFKKGERLTKLNVEASDNQSPQGYRRLGAIWFSTNKGNSWGIFSNDLKESGVYWQDVGSGICCGVFGAKGADVDRFGFAMLRKINKSTIVDVEYPNLSTEIVASTPETVAQQTFRNGGTVDQTYILRGKKSVTTTRAWSITNELSLSHTLTVSAGIPGVAEIGGETSWAVGMTSSHSVSTTKTEEQSWEWPIVCPPHTGMVGTATMYSDEITTDYVGKMELQLDNGKVYNYTIKGEYNGLNVRTGAVNVDDFPLDD